MSENSKADAFKKEFQELLDKYNMRFVYSREYCYCEGPCCGPSASVYFVGEAIYFDADTVASEY